MHASLAYAEATKSYEYLTPSTNLSDENKLNGTKSLVLNGKNASKLIVSCIKNDGDTQVKVKKTFSFDLLPVDDVLFSIAENELRNTVSRNAFKGAIDKVKAKYDYIIIDSSPNWNFFSKSAVQAADVVLMPTKSNDISALHNAAITVSQYIPEVRQEIRKNSNNFDFGAIALPIFFNGGKKIFKPNSNNASAKLVEEAVKKIGDRLNFDLKPYFYPKGAISNIFELTNHSSISKAAFDGIPAAYKSKVAYRYYTELAKEYFLQGVTIVILEI